MKDEPILIMIKKYPAFIIILFAFIGFFISYTVLRSNMVVTPVKGVEVLVAQDTSKMTIIYDTLAIKSKYYIGDAVKDSSGIKLSEDNQRKVEYESLVFNHNPKFLIWMIVFSLMTSYAFSFLPILLHRIKNDLKFFRISKAERIAAIILSVIILFAYALGSGDSKNLLSILDINELTGVLFKNRYLLEILIVANIAVGMLAFVGQLLIGIAISKLSPDSGKKSLDKTIERFNRYRESLKFYLSFSAGMISFSVITSSFLRKSLLAVMDAGTFQLFPVEFIFAYGVSFTLVLAIFYLPIYYHLRLKGESLKKEFLDMNLDKEHEEMANSVFTITEKGISNFKVALSILSPLITSILGDIISLA